jgi:hypothetical protein
MELSFEVKQKIDDFIAEAEIWLMNQPKPPILKLDAKFGAVAAYIKTKKFYNREINFAEFEIIDTDTLLANFQKEHPEFSNSCSHTELWKKWEFLVIENSIETIYMRFYNHNDKFDYGLCEELDQKNEQYHVPENIVIHLYLDYNEGIVFLNVADEDDY